MCVCIIIIVSICVYVCTRMKITVICFVANYILHAYKHGSDVCMRKRVCKQLS